MEGLTSAEFVIRWLGALERESASSPRRELPIFEPTTGFVKRGKSNKLTGAKSILRFHSGFPQCPVTTVTEQDSELGETSFVTKVREPVRRFL